MAEERDVDKAGGIGLRRLLSVLVGVGSMTLTGVVLSVSSAAPAFANSEPYELFCPGTPVGTVVINDVTTTASITPVSPAAGTQFNVTNYQTSLTLVSQIAKAAYAIQTNHMIQGTANASVDVTGATPSSMNLPTFNIDAPITDSGDNGVPLMLPASPTTVGPFTATGGPISVTEGISSSLTLELNGSPLQTSCTAYPNNANATGIATSSTGSGTATAPVIATASSSSATTTTTTTTSSSSSTATTATTVSTATTTTASATSSLAGTGPGNGEHVFAYVGLSLVGFSVLLLVFKPSRRLFVRAAGSERSAGNNASTGRD